MWDTLNQADEAIVADAKRQGWRVEYTYTDVWGDSFVLLSPTEKRTDTLRTLRRRTEPAAWKAGIRQGFLK